MAALVAAGDHLGVVGGVELFLDRHHMGAGRIAVGRQAGNLEYLPAA